MALRLELIRSGTSLLEIQKPMYLPQEAGLAAAVDVRQGPIRAIRET
jgi:hypothetical protein